MLDSAVMETPRLFKNIAVFCGSSADARGLYFDAARAVGVALAERGIGVVYGGGRVGLMGAVADAALGAGGRGLGVIPEKLMALEVGHTRLTELRIVPDMHTRKLAMATAADAFVALPGGLGTLDEVFEAATWTQLNYHLKPVGLLNVKGFFDPLVRFLDHAADEGFIRPQHRSLIQVDETIDGLLHRLATCPIVPLSIDPPPAP